MKNLKLLLFVLMIPLLSCTNDEKNDAKYFSKSFIDSYIDNIEEISLKNENSALLISCDKCMQITEYTNSVRMNELANQYSDTSYNQWRAYSSGACFAEPISKISVKSDKNFDNAHLAGEPLDDIIMLESLSPLKYIQSGYKNVTWDNPSFVGWYAINDYLSNLDESDMTMLHANYMHLKFMQQPTLEHTHNISLSITFKSGKTLTATQKIVFE